MEGGRFASIGDVVLDESFPELDLALRRGRHIDRDEGGWYALLVDAQPELEAFYRRYGCELVHKTDGYFYLLPTGDKLGKRQLSVPEMLVGQGLALLLLDPCTVESGGVVSREDVVAHLSRVMGPTTLVKALNPKKRRLDERVAEETVRTRVAEALRRLATMGFIQPLDGNRLRLRTPLLRFAEPARAGGSLEKALEELVAKGELTLGAGEGEDDDAGESGAEIHTPSDGAELPVPAGTQAHETPDQRDETPHDSSNSAPPDLDACDNLFDEPGTAGDRSG